MENYNFEQFSAAGGRISPTINLNASGFGVSAGFVKKYDLSDEKAVHLFYDKNKNAVGVKFLKEKEDGALGLILAANRGGGYINSKAFLIKYDIDPRKYQGRYTPKEIDTPQFGKVFVIELEENNESSQETPSSTNAS